MIFELEVDEFERVRPVYAGLQDRVAIAATIEGKCPGRVFVDDPTQPSVAFMWNAFRFSYLAGDPGNDAFNASLRQLLTDSLLPEARDSHDPTLVVYPYPKAWGEGVSDLIGDRPVINLFRRTFVFSHARLQYDDWQDCVPPGFRMQRVDEGLLATSGREMAGEIRLLWRSLDDFLEKGIGFCLLKGDEIVSTCFSAFAGGARLEIGVGTHKEHRRRGFATLTALACISHCLREGVEPVWECWADNIPSVGLADKLGFEGNVDYPVHFIDLKSGPEQGDQSC